MSYTLATGGQGTVATAEVVWSVNGQTYKFRSDNNFLSWIQTIFDVADSLNIIGGLDLLLTDQIPPAEGGTGNIFAKYGTTGTVAGDARGEGAVDLQQYRTLATQVASGGHATLGGGFGNTASGDKSTVGGGSYNTAVNNYSTVGGGYSNTASDNYATVGGGKSNSAPNSYATVGGGNQNSASDNFATVGGGSSNTASSAYATVGGGFQNTASSAYATVGGGQNNSASAYTHATVGGGSQNTASGYCATLGGGYGNTASGFYATVGGGKSNTAPSNKATVGGGFQNTASAISATVGGGSANTASGYYATVVGGLSGLADRYGMLSHASGAFSAQGDAQAVEFVAFRQSFGTIPVTLFLDGISTVFGVRLGTVLSGLCTISGIKSDGSEVAIYQRSICIKNIAGTTTLLSSSDVGTDYEDDATWNVVITANNTNDSLDISCVGGTGDTVRWVAVFRGLEILVG
jgi:hypothetical protein